MEYYLGQICLFAFDYETPDFILCDGRSLNASQNAALYALLGNKFGGNNIAFNIPNLLNASPVNGMRYYICTAGIFPSRQ
jgi:microcystin-dependent protein